MKSWGEALGWEVGEVGGDYRTCSSNDCCPDDVFVVGIRKAITSLKAFPAFNFGVVEATTHFRDEELGATTGVRLRNARVQ